MKVFIPGNEPQSIGEFPNSLVFILDSFDTDDVLVLSGLALRGGVVLFIV